MSVIAFIGVFVYFQIIKPLIDNTPLFPFFSEKEKVEGQIAEEEESLEVNKERKKLNKLKEKSSKKEQKNEETN